MAHKDSLFSIIPPESLRSEDHMTMLQNPFNEPGEIGAGDSQAVPGAGTSPQKGPKLLLNNRQSRSSNQNKWLPFVGNYRTFLNNSVVSNAALLAGFAVI